MTYKNKTANGVFESLEKPAQNDKDLGYLSDESLPSNLSFRSTVSSEDEFDPSLLTLYKSFTTSHTWHRICFCFPTSWNTFLLNTFAFMDDPTTSKSAMAYSWFMILVVLLSLTELVLGSFESLVAQHSWKNTLFIIDAVTSGIFTFDYVVRLVLSPGGWCEKFKFVTNIFNIFDLLSVIPFYLTLLLDWNFTSGISTLRILRIAKLFRLLRLGKYSPTVFFLYQAIDHAKEGVLFLLMLIVVVSTLIGALMYYAEIADCYLSEDLEWIYKSGIFKGYPTFFQNIPLGMYWTVVVVSTVGYGEAVPYSWYGRSVAVLAIIMALILIGFPFTIIGNAFSRKANEFKEKTAELRAKEAARKLKHWRKKRMKRIFDYEEAKKVAEIEAIDGAKQAAERQAMEDPQLARHKAERKAAETTPFEVEAEIVASFNSVTTANTISGNSNFRRKYLGIFDPKTKEPSSISAALMGYGSRKTPVIFEPRPKSDSEDENFTGITYDNDFSSDSAEGLLHPPDSLATSSWIFTGTPRMKHKKTKKNAVINRSPLKTDKFAEATFAPESSPPSKSPRIDNLTKPEKRAENIELPSSLTTIDFSSDILDPADPSPSPSSKRTNLGSLIKTKTKAQTTDNFRSLVKGEDFSADALEPHFPLSQNQTPTGSLRKNHKNRTTFENLRSFLKENSSDKTSTGQRSLLQKSLLKKGKRQNEKNPAELAIDRDLKVIHALIDMEEKLERMKALVKVIAKTIKNNEGESEIESQIETQSETNGEKYNES